LFVTEQGFVARARVIQSSGSQRLDNAAIEGTRTWRFAPALVADTPACMWVSVPVTFKLP
jgi:TonB family protein